MSIYLITIAVIFAMLVAFVLVDRLYRRFAACNPQLGPFRSRNDGCSCCAAAAKCGKQTGKASSAERTT